MEALVVERILVDCLIYQGLPSRTGSNPGTAPQADSAEGRRGAAVPRADRFRTLPGSAGGCPPSIGTHHGLDALLQAGDLAVGEGRPDLVHVGVVGRAPGEHGTRGQVSGRQVEDDCGSAGAETPVADRAADRR